MARKPVKSRTIGAVGFQEPRSMEDFRQEDQTVRADLRRIGLLSAFFFLFLLALAVVLR